MTSNQKEIVDIVLKSIRENPDDWIYDYYDVTNRNILNGCRLVATSYSRSSVKVLVNNNDFLFLEAIRSTKYDNEPFPGVRAFFSPWRREVVDFIRRKGEQFYKDLQIRDIARHKNEERRLELFLKNEKNKG